MGKDFLESLWLSAKVIGLMPVAALGVVTALTTLLINLNASAQETQFALLLEIVLPVLAAVLWAYVVAPPSDPCLEVLLTCRLRLNYIRLTRFAVLLLQVLVVAVLYSVFTGSRSSDAAHFVLLGMVLLLPRLLLFMGISGLVTVLSTNAALGLSVLSLVVIACLMMIQMWEYLQSITLLTLVFPFLYSATHALNGINGLLVSLIGLVLIGLSLVLPVSEAGLFRHPSSE